MLEYGCVEIVGANSYFQSCGGNIQENTEFLVDLHKETTVHL